ncbi:MAG: DUF131 domain-containing protein [Candidatus Bathyarchaeia archaeon]
MGLEMASTSLTLSVSPLQGLGLTLILLGILTLIIAFAILLISSIKGGRVRGGGAVIIGPIPIVFGTDKESMRAVLWFSIILTLIVFTLFLALQILGR